MSDWLTGTVVAVALMFAFLMGATWATRREQQAYREYREVAECPPGTWTMNTCVPVGCQWRFDEHRWECRP